MKTIIGKTGRDVSLATVARMLNLNVSTINYWYDNHNFKTLKEYEDRAELNRKQGNTRTKKKGKTFNTYFGLLTAVEIRALVNQLYNNKNQHISIETVYSRLFKWPEDSITIFFPKGSRKHFLQYVTELQLDPPWENYNVSVKSTPPATVATFNTNNFCYRNNFLEKCKHYTSCEDSRCFYNCHHHRYKIDNSCYIKKI